MLSSAFLLSIFLVANGVNAIFGGFEYSYHVKLTRNFFRQYAYALMVGLILSILLIIGAVAFVYFEFYITNVYFGFSFRILHSGYFSNDAIRNWGFLIPATDNEIWDLFLTLGSRPSYFRSCQLCFVSTIWHPNRLAQDSGFSGKRLKRDAQALDGSEHQKKFAYPDHLSKCDGA